MTVADWTAGVSRALTAAGAVVATLAWRTSAGVRRDQAEAEALRRYREMRPVLAVNLEKQPDLDRALLRVKLVGPRDAERYDRIRVEVRDDGKVRTPRGDVTEQAIREQVWGPFWFRSCIDGGSEDHRSAVQDGRAVIDEWRFNLFPALAPRWYGGGDQQWREDYKGALVRLRIEVGLGDQSWAELFEVPQPPRSAYEDGGLTVV